MENEANNTTRKRAKASEEDKEMEVADGSIAKAVEEDIGLDHALSEQMELEISHILEKINRFTELVSELLESGKTMLKELANDFEERMISIHKEQMEKWQDEIKDLRLLDVSNEETNAILQNAKLLFHSIPNGS